MGSGISLNERQIEHIIKRDCKHRLDAFMQSPPPCAQQYTYYRNYLEEAKYHSCIHMIDEYAKQRREGTQ
jgi:hypothetical protein